MYKKEEHFDEMDHIEEPQQESIIGKVTGCQLLNVRQGPSLESEVLCIIMEGSEVEIIDDPEANENFYRVCNAAGLEGYCMKKFIEFV